MRESAKDLDARSMLRVLTDNLLVECASGLTRDESRSAVNMWLSVNNDEEALRAQVELDMIEVTENISKYTSKTACLLKRKAMQVGRSRA